MFLFMSQLSLSVDVIRCENGTFPFFFFGILTYILNLEKMGISYPLIQSTSQGLQKEDTKLTLSSLASITS